MKTGILKLLIYTLITIILVNIVYNFTIDNIIGFPIVFWFSCLYGIFLGINLKKLLGMN